jgi:hypothetical protein
MNRINLLSRGALREEKSSSSEMGYSQTGLSGRNSSANFNPFQFGTGQGPRRGVSSYYSFPPCARSRSAPGTPPDTVGEIDALHHSMPNITYSHEMLPIEEELGPLNHSLPNLNHSVPDLNYTHHDETLNHSVPNLNYTHEEARLNHSVPNLNYTHEDVPFRTASTDIEPIPYDQYSPLNRKRSLKKEIFSMNTAVTDATATRTKTQARSAETESDDLLTCLVKLTETTIGDDNPYEPIPLANSSEHMVSIDHSRFDDMASEFEDDQSESLGRGEPQGIDA